MKHLAIASLAVALLAAPATAGIHFESVTRVDGAQGGNVTVEGWVDGNSAKVSFKKSDNPLLTEGAYLLTTDGGRTVILVDPDEKTYAPFDLEQMMAGAGAMLQAMGPLAKISFSNPEVEKLAEEPGPELLGRATTHYRFRTTYDSEVRVMGMGQKSSNETIADTWTTKELADEGFGLYLRRDPPRTGIADLDRLIAAEVGKGIEGVPLKSVTVTVSKDQKGRESRSTATMEVTSLRETAIPAGTFQVPAGYERVEAAMALPFAQ